MSDDQTDDDKTTLSRRSVLLSGTTLAGATLLPVSQAAAAASDPQPNNTRPNVVFILVDNVGWGDFGVYGGITPTPRIDEMASQGMRFTNYNVEIQCTPTRSAIMTGRMPVRTGNWRVPFPGEGEGGLVPWEYTIGKLFADAGYATALYGKWHVGDTQGRMPNDMGFDEWWGLRKSSDEAGYSRYALFRQLGLPTPEVWEGRRGSPSKPVEEFNLETKRFMDENIAKRSVEYIKRQAALKKPFFLYVGFTQVHPPITVHPDFDGKSPARGGFYADLIGELDFRTGQILDAIKAAGIEGDTIVVFSSDNTTGGVVGAGGGSNGPWRGNFFTPSFEGSYRTAAMVRWPNHVPAGIVTNEALASIDWLPTLAALAGESKRVPTDRPIDGVDASPLLLGKSPQSPRDAVMLFGPDGELMSVKWRTIKVVFRYTEGIEKPIGTAYLPIVYDLSSDPGETTNLWELTMDMGWTYAPVLKTVAEYTKSLEQFPNIKPGQKFAGYK